MAATGARCLGPAVPDDGLQDESWQADRLLAEGDRVDCGGVSLQVIETPGHVGNHLCYLSEDGLLFTGDHLIQGSTVVIAPPSGSMQPTSPPCVNSSTAALHAWHRATGM